jgi:hypothetical protein
MDLESFNFGPPTTLLTPIIENPSSSLPLNTGGSPQFPPQICPQIK